MKAVCILFIITCSHLSYSQTDDFQKLLNLYDGERNIIDSLIAIKYFGQVFGESGNQAYSDKILIQTSTFIAISCYIPCGAGGICEKSTLGTFTFSGNSIDKIDFESEYADCSFDNKSSCIFYSDSLVIILNEENKTDCENLSITSIKISLDFISVSSSGQFSLPNKVNIDTRRKYYMTSSTFLTKESLKNKSKNDLEEMRNEIFASHGYIFKTENWKTYFSNEVWYYPISEDVSDSLTFIERKNIELISLMERN